ncbi:TusA-related sulfurtransferase [Geosporobacter subterraneus DSM 17957]|uniref:TusA-related sulfurtransferase n=1 Tax=Geosporobacter subterraneus DSM 17957 TaxID=1121919 RepID=A0A1M6MFU6_9FIRM|nr:sulfurtransferase TusA family protein [Geosporobacter subterraneus]SHJ82359.1 TusA-related sulfurtransferase [Geosporobacter subterraneus DSM 17957]
MAEILLNCKGLQCPGPIMQVFKTAKEAESGDTILVKVTDRGFAKDIQAWCKKTGNELLELNVGETEISAKILKK